jgi:hypothetical protein
MVRFFQEANLTCLSSEAGSRGPPITQHSTRRSKQGRAAALHSWILITHTLAATSPCNPHSVQRAGGCREGFLGRNR